MLEDQVSVLGTCLEGHQLSDEAYGCYLEAAAEALALRHPPMSVLVLAFAPYAGDKEEHRRKVCMDRSLGANSSRLVLHSVACKTAARLMHASITGCSWKL